MRLGVVLLVALMLASSASVCLGAPPPKTLIHNFPLSWDPGWTTEGQWAWGQPQGIGGDPSSGNTRPYVYGYNLAGTYANSIPAYSLTTTAIDCSQLRNTQLRFWRWLGVEPNIWDQALVQVSNDGTSWTTIWSNPGSVIQDVSWSQWIFDISAVADGQPTVYLRWVMGPTDSIINYSGWNIDDVQIWADTSDPPLQVLVWLAYADPYRYAQEYKPTLEALRSQYPDFVATNPSPLTRLPWRRSCRASKSS